MNREQVYQWMEQVRMYLKIGKWQGLVVSAFSLGVMQARNCKLSVVAEGLGILGKADSVERRLQRFLSNERVNVAACQRAWVKWVMSKVDTEPGVTLLVDETKLSDHMSVMVVGLAFKQRCILLAWRCYAPHAWPTEQVRLIRELLERVKAVIPSSCQVVVQADRGIGTSPDLVRAVRELGWHYLFRVQGLTHFQSPMQPDTELRTLTTRGGRPFCSAGQVFKSDGWIDSHVRVIWDAAYDEPWCLISDLVQLNGREYGKRNWQEQSFRDLKSGGWRWNDSQVWQPDHAERLLLVLALAYALTLSLGLRLQDQPELRSQVLRGSRQRYSWFRLGLRLLAALKRLTEPIRFFLDFRQPVSPLALSGWLS